MVVGPQNSQAIHKNFEIFIKDINLQEINTCFFLDVINLQEINTFSFK